MALPLPYFTCCRSHVCACPPRAMEDFMQPMEHERRAFEDYMREFFPDRSLDRFMDTYADDKVRNRWIGWQGRAKAVTVTVVARRVPAPRRGTRDTG